MHNFIRSFHSKFPSPWIVPATGIHRHYKGNLYYVLGNVLHTETQEIMVLYRSVNPTRQMKQENPTGITFVRPIDSFMEQINIDGKMIPRFKRIEVHSSSQE